MTKTENKCCFYFQGNTVSRPRIHNPIWPFKGYDMAYIVYSIFIVNPHSEYDEVLKSNSGCKGPSGLL